MQTAKLQYRCNLKFQYFWYAILFRTISISLYTLFFYVLLLENQVEGELEKLILLFTIDWGK